MPTTSEAPTAVVRFSVAANGRDRSRTTTRPGGSIWTIPGTDLLGADLFPDMSLEPVD